MEQVQCREVQEVKDEQELGDEELGINPQQDEGDLDNVVDDE